MLVEFDLLVVADGADFLALTIDFMGFEAINSIGGTKLADLKPGQYFGVADDEFAVEVNLDHSSKMFLVVDFDFLLIPNDAYMARDNLCLEALYPVLWSQFADRETGKAV